MNTWLKLLIAGLVIGPVGGFAALVLGWTQSIDALLWLSVAVSALGAILFWVGLVGFLVTRLRSNPSSAK